jgi:tetratricopeptide (TPR) repeat protein
MNDKSSDYSTYDQRVIRVFVSSTFRDMQAERDELVKYTFPKLRKLCDERGVVWSEVDLRWGITEEQSERGEVLPICLAEIQRCRPYFIGLLGERYGWIPDEIPPELIEQEDWLKEHLNHSVTELEILHGVLNDEKMNDHALFYFRDSVYLNSLSDEEKADFIETATDDEIKKHGRAEAENRAENRRRKLKTLKEKIKEHCGKNVMPAPREFPNPKELGEMVLRDMSEIIERLYPKDEIPDQLDRDALEHEAFAESRKKVYIGRQNYFERLDTHAQSEDQPLIILGESGSGKSALLANWALEYRKTHPQDLLIMHFIGATPYSADWAAMLRRIMGELKRRFEIQQEIPDKPDELRPAFANFLYMAAAKGRCVLILDALNQLEDRDGAPDLVWLPPVIPPNVRMILSTLPGRTLDNLKERGWETLPIEPLDFAERKRLIKDYLAQFSKELNEKRTEQLAYAEQTSNPLFLRALLDELRVFGIYERLNERIEHYLEAETIDKLYEKILTRYEQDYERERPGLVKDAMSLIWASRRGLSEAELLDLLGKNNEPLPRAYWSPLYLAAEESLINRSGIITFSNEFLRNAVQNHYFPNPEVKKEFHHRLADYFANQPLGLRRIDEQPWQYLQSEEWTNLRNTLTDLLLFKLACNNGYRFVWISYWTAISEKFSPETSYEFAVAEYIRQKGETLELARIMQFVGWMLHDMALFDPSLPFKERSLAIRESELPPNHPDIATSLNDLAEYFRHQRRYKDARILFEKSLAIFERSVAPDSDLIASSLNNLSVLYHEEGDHETALTLLKRAINIEELALPEADPQRITGLINLADIYLSLNNYQNAHQFIEQALETSKKFLGANHPLVASCLEHLGVLYGSEGNEEQSVICHKQALVINQRVFGENHPSVAVCLHNIAASANAQGKFDEAKKLYQHAFRIFELVYGNDHVRLTECLSSLANNYQEQGKYTEALELAERILTIRERTLQGNNPDVAEIHNRLGELNAIIARFDEALFHHQKAREIREQLYGFDDISVAQSLNNLAELYRRKGQFDMALPLNDHALSIRTRVLGDDHIAVAESLNNLGVTYYQMGEYPKAFDYCERSLIIKEKRLGGEHPLVADTLNNLGQILFSEGDFANALPLHKRALAIRTSCFGHEHPAVAESLNNLGMLFNERGEIDRAINYYEQAMKIKEKIFGKEHPAVAGALNNLAVVNYQSGRPEIAVRFFRCSLSIYDNILGPNHPETIQVRENLRVCESRT